MGTVRTQLLRYYEEMALVYRRQHPSVSANTVVLWGLTEGYDAELARDRLPRLKEGFLQSSLLEAILAELLTQGTGTCTLGRLLTGIRPGGPSGAGPKRSHGTAPRIGESSIAAATQARTEVGRLEVARTGQEMMAGKSEKGGPRCKSSESETVAGEGMPLVICGGSPLPTVLRAGAKPDMRKLGLSMSGGDAGGALGGEGGRSKPAEPLRKHGDRRNAKGEVSDRPSGHGKGAGQGQPGRGETATCTVRKPADMRDGAGKGRARNETSRHGDSASVQEGKGQEVHRGFGETEGKRPPPHT